MLNHLTDISAMLHALENEFSISITHIDGYILYVNDKFCTISKYTRDEIIGQPHSIFDSHLHPADYFSDLRSTLERGLVWKKDVHNKAKDGSFYSVSATVIPIFNEQHQLVKYMSVDSDITEKVQTKDKLEMALKQQFQHVVKHLQNAIFKYKETDEGQLLLTMIEGKLAKRMGMPSDLESPISFEDILPAHTVPRFYPHLKRGLAGEELHFEIDLFDRFFLVYLSPIKEDGRVIEVVGTAIDITTRKQAEKRIHQMAHYDDLTGLANRRLFQKELTAELDISSKNKEPFAVMFLDLDRFKNVNDTMGHSNGDLLLIKVADRLRKCIRQTDIAARLGGDEYAILLPSITRKTAGMIAKRICDEMNHFFLIENLDIFISTSIGISMYPADGTDAEALIQNADAAMYFAKEKGKNNYQFFTVDLHRDLSDKMMLEREMHKAIDEQQFYLEYQPQIDMKTNKIIGTEALLRWNHPKIGLISPADFIPLAEETGLIIPIGSWVLETACAQNKAWQEAGFPPVRMSVNVSLRQFMQQHFVEKVEHILEQTGLAPEWLDLEITESMTADVSHAQKVLTCLREIGIHVSIDDFGTGYSSLSYLGKFPITKLKIDQSFVRDLSEDHQAIVKTIIDLARNLNMKVIAEGVESQEQARLLLEMNCTEAQGYLYARPLSALDMTKKLSG